MKRLQKLIFTSLLVGASFTALSAPVTSNTASNPTEQTVSAPLNINTANAEQLMLLPGIGESKAKAIVKFREQYGTFANVDELTKVKGIGTKLLQKVSTRIVAK